MATEQNFVDYVVDQIKNTGTVSSKKMFGEYAVYLDGKVIALVCDNQLFIKPTSAGRTFIADELQEAAPYPGAKLHFLIDDRLDDRDWLCRLVRITAQELPEPKEKKRK